MCISPLLRTQIYILAVLTILCFMNPAASADINFPNPKAKAVYESINRKIEDLNKEREKKKNAVKARHYDSYKEKEYLDKLDAKYDAVIERYKDKCNTYFKRAGAEPPWHTKKLEEEKRAVLEKLRKAKEAAEKKLQEEYRKKLEQKNSSSVPTSPSSSPAETDDSFIKPPPPPQLPDDSDVYTPQPSQEDTTLPQTETQPIAQTTVNTASQENTTSSGITPIAAGVTTLISLILAVISVIILIVAWKKMTVILKSACGCSTIFFGILTLASGAFLVYSIMFSGKPSSTQQTAPATISSVTKGNGVQVISTQPPGIIQPSSTAPEPKNTSTYQKAIKLPDDIKMTKDESKYPGVNILVLKAKKAIKNNDMNALKAVLNKAKQKVEENPDSVDDLMNLGLILFMMDNNEEVNLLADKAFSQVLKLQPDNIEAQRMLADVRYRSELFDSAIILLEPLIESGDWMDKKTVALITLCYARDEQYEAGLEFLGRMADKNPNRPDIRIDYAVLARQAGEYSLAKQALNKVLSKPDLKPETRKWAEGVMAMCNAGGKSK